MSKGTIDIYVDLVDVQLGELSCMMHDLIPTLVLPSPAWGLFLSLLLISAGTAGGAGGAGCCRVLFLLLLLLLLHFHHWITSWGE